MTEELTSLLQPLCSVFHPVFTEIPSPTQGIPGSEASVPGVAMQHWHHVMMTKIQTIVDGESSGTSSIKTPAGKDG